ncbi:MAG: hypothetical protein ACKO6A_03510 [Bacteroidota bacterium]
MSTFLKSIPLFILLLFVGSCCSQKELSNKKNSMCEGIVYLSQNGCPYFIEITESSIAGIDVGNKIYPVQLNEKFKQNGLKIIFDALISRAPSPSDCMVNNVVVLSDIKVIP